MSSTSPSASAVLKFQYKSDCVYGYVPSSHSSSFAVDLKDKSPIPSLLTIPSEFTVIAGTPPTFDPKDEAKLSLGGSVQIRCWCGGCDFDGRSRQLVSKHLRQSGGHDILTGTVISYHMTRDSPLGMWMMHTERIEVPLACLVTKVEIEKSEEDDDLDDDDEVDEIDE